MSSVKVKQIQAKLRSMFEQHLDLSDIGPKDLEADHKILTRCLSALTIYLLSGCTEKEAAQAVWDGSDDNGIDAAYFDQATSRVILIQSKFINKGAGEPEAKEISTFTKGIRDIIEQDNTSFHSRLHPRFSDIALRIATPGTRVHYVVSSTGSSSLAKHGLSVLDTFLDELNGDDPDPIASYEVLGLIEIYNGLVNDPSQGSISLDAQILDWSYVSTPHSAYFGVIDGPQLKGWWKNYGRRVVSANIRHALGQTDVNNEIRKTATSSPELFWYFNNGITLVADEAQKAPAKAASQSVGTFSFKNASIVNGAQTVSSLGAVEDDAALGKVKVPIRVILLKDTPLGFGDVVTRTNNLQNRVESRDFVSQDPEQKRLRQEMAIEDVDYQIVRSEESAISSTSCDLIEVTTSLACASGDSLHAVQVKTGIGRFFLDLKKAPYKTLFNPTVSGSYAFNATVVMRGIDAWIENKKKVTPRKGPSWGALVHGNRILAAAVFAKFGTAKLSSSIKDFSNNLSTTEIDAHCEDAYAKMVSHLAAQYEGKFLATLFKNPSMSNDVYNASVI